MTCKPGYIGWIYDLFGDCIITERDKWSFGVGMLSNSIWLVCSLPQIIHNYKTKRVGGFSPFYFSLMFIADVFSLSGAIITHGLPTQIITGCIYVTLDCILLFQFTIYGGWSCFKGKSIKILDDNELLGNMTVPLMVANAAAFDYSVPYRGKFLFGTVSGWIGTSLYIGSRILQFLKNIERKYISDFSPVYLFFIITANLTYFLFETFWLKEARAPRRE